MERFEPERVLVDENGSQFTVPMYKCDYCNKVFPRPSKVLTHRRTHTGEKPFHCPVCDRGFAQRKTMLEHKATHTLLFNYKCQHCEAAFKQSGGLSMHMKNVHFDKPKLFTCKRCKVNYDTKEALNRHQKTHRKDTLPSCDRCGKRFTRQSQVKVHKMIHTGEKPFKCTVCEREFQSNCEAIIHAATHTFDSLTRYQCEMCAQVFSSIEVFDRHDCEVTSDIPNQCETTLEPPHETETTLKHSHEITTTLEPPHVSETTLEHSNETNTTIEHSHEMETTVKHSHEIETTVTHLHEIATTLEPSHKSGITPNLTHEPERTLTLTPKITPDEIILSEDLMVLTPEIGPESASEMVLTILSDEYIMCSQCNSYIHHSLLVDHVRIEHNYKYVHQCEFCKKCFRTKDILNVHIRVHTNVRPFQCDQCLKSFKQRGHLSEHMRVHTRHPGNLQCERCNLRFVRPGKLASHKCLVYVCAICQKSFLEMDKLRKHECSVNKKVTIPVDSEINVVYNEVEDGADEVMDAGPKERDTTTEVLETSKEVHDPSREDDEPSQDVDDPSHDVDDPSPDVDDPSPGVSDPSSEVNDSSSDVDEPSPEVLDPSPEVQDVSPDVRNLNLTPEVHNPPQDFLVVQDLTIASSDLDETEALSHLDDTASPKTVHLNTSKNINPKPSDKASTLRSMKKTLLINASDKTQNVSTPPSTITTTHSTNATNIIVDGQMMNIGSREEIVFIELIKSPETIPPKSAASRNDTKCGYNHANDKEKIRKRRIDATCSSSKSFALASNDDDVTQKPVAVFRSHETKKQTLEQETSDSIDTGTATDANRHVQQICHIKEIEDGDDGDEEVAKKFQIVQLTDGSFVSIEDAVETRKAADFIQVHADETQSPLRKRSTFEIMQNNDPSHCKACGRRIHSISPAHTAHPETDKHNKEGSLCDFCTRLKQSSKPDHKFISPQSCYICQKTFKSRATLRSHLSTAHSDIEADKRFQCDICGRFFTRKHKLLLHMQYHMGELPHQCTECGVSCTSKKNLLKHLKAHARPRPYACPHCEKSFAKVSTLRTHVLSHTGEKPYPCDMCQKSFRQRGHLIEHRRSHTGERVFHCTDCSYSFQYRSGLAYHNKRRHSNNNNSFGTIIYQEGGEVERFSSDMPVVYLEDMSESIEDVSDNIDVHDLRQLSRLTEAIAQVEAQTASGGTNSANGTVDENEVTIHN